MAAPNLAWGGFKNGQIPRANLVDIGGGKLLQADAASNLDALADEFAEAFPGSRLYVAPGQDTYRDLAYQTAKSGTGNHNYKPGGSIHGWARSADLSGYGRSDDSTTERHRWLQANAGRFGWSWAYGKQLGEAWHWDYIGPITTLAGGGTSAGGNTTTTRRESDMDLNFLKADAPGQPQGYLLTGPGVCELFPETSDGKPPASALGWGEILHVDVTSLKNVGQGSYATAQASARLFHEQVASSTPPSSEVAIDYAKLAAEIIKAGGKPLTAAQTTAAAKSALAGASIIPKAG